MPGRLGPRFAVEAGFLILLAVGAGLADLRPRVIVIVMAIAWFLVALIEFTADRISTTFPPWRRPVWLSTDAQTADESTPEAAREDDRHSATVVAPVPPSGEEADVEPDPRVAEPERAPAPERVASDPSLPRLPVVEAGEDAGAEPSHPEESEPAADQAEAVDEPRVQNRLEPLQPRPRRSWFRRRREDGPERGPRDEAPPRHVRLLPPAAESSRASREVAEIFGPAEHDDADEHRA